MSRNLAIIGVGHVGAHVANAVALQGLADEIILIDKNGEKVASEVNDLNDSLSFFPRKVTIKKGDFSDLTNTDIIINSVGKIEILTQIHDRLGEMDFTIPAVHSYLDKIKKSGFKGIVINITNPCDIVTKYIAENLDLPEGHVFGTGTGLDSARLISAISRRTGIDTKSISAYMIGEHGNKQIAAFSSVNFNGLPLALLAKSDKRFAFNREEVEKEAINAGWVTYNGKHCTEYAIALTAARLVEDVFSDKKEIIPVSARLSGQYGEKDVFAGVPAVIGKNGVEEVLELPLSKDESDRFHECCEALRKNEGHIKDIKLC